MNERLKAAIDAVEASNPTPTPEPATPDPIDKTATPADEQGDNAATDAEGQQAEGAEDSEDSAASDGTGAPAQRQNKGVGKRINELTREKYEAIRRAEAAERRVQEMEQKPQTPAGAKPAPTTPTEGKPTLEQYNFDQEAYLDALADWRVTQRLTERESQQQERQKQDQDRQRQAQFQERLTKFEAENPGKWEAATKAPINFTDAMLEVIASSDVGPHIASYLADNLDRADEISRMPPYAAAAALGRIEASMSAAKPVTPPSPPRTVTKAPPPPSTVQGGAVVRKDLASMEVADHIEAVRAKKSR